MNRLRNLLSQNLPTIATRIESTWPTVAELAASTGAFDYLEFVAECAPFAQVDLENLARTTELWHTGSMIKVDLQNRAYVAQKALAAGFEAVLFTDHKTADQVRASIALIRPDTPQDGGYFGIPARRFTGPSPDQITYAAMLRQTVVAVMIEKKEALENLEQICSVPGVDMVQFGPSDYSMSLGWNRQEHAEEVEEAEAYMIRTALKHGVHPRCEISTPEEAQRYWDMGVRHFCIGDELKNQQATWESMGGGLRKRLNQWTYQLSGGKGQ